MWWLWTALALGAGPVDADDTTGAADAEPRAQDALPDPRRVTFPGRLAGTLGGATFGGFALAGGYGLAAAVADAPVSNGLTIALAEVGMVSGGAAVGALLTPGTPAYPELVGALAGGAVGFLAASPLLGNGPFAAAGALFLAPALGITAGVLVAHELEPAPSFRPSVALVPVVGRRSGLAVVGRF